MAGGERWSEEVRIKLVDTGRPGVLGGRAGTRAQVGDS